MADADLAGTLTASPEVHRPPPTPPPQPPSRAPLLAPRENPLDCALRRLEAFLALLSFPSSAAAPRLPLRLILSAAAFVLLGVALPSAAFALSRSAAGGGHRIDGFEITVVVSEAAAAAVSLACVSRGLVKYGIRRFLFVDQQHGQDDRLQKEYLRKIQDFFYLLFWWILPCFVVKTVREIVRFVYIFHESIWRAVVVLLASVASWTYLTTIYLSSCTIFNLVCNLQVVHFEDYGKLLEQDADPLVYVQEHLRLRYNLYKISHRFRIFLLLVFLCVTASQFVILFETTGHGGTVNFTSAADIAVSSIVQVVGIVLCLHAATKISHRAQGIASLASRWHALVTCNSSDSTLPRVTNSSGNLEAFPADLLLMDYSESDVESLDNVTVHTNAQLASYMSSYHKREALVLYLLSSPSGITIFGWTVDRTLLNTIFFIEMSLVLFVLGKTIASPTKPVLTDFIRNLHPNKSMHE
ncbi:uncharacterized protein LOC109714367 isoform X1 [Ananas comosus]|uniref:Uncharacterized protein LOC109714367 isoform X1 n=1 Tax=Ananas comosus TaxID=4615 RepID=A0A6P5FG70_ANACO|nr:uncharacterized protein LOC109714367 isoform X1 [Ananas comosus]